MFVFSGHLRCDRHAANFSSNADRAFALYSLDTSKEHFMPRLAILLLALLSITANAQTKPNILILLSDDVGYAEYGFQGGKDIPTPNLDSIAKNGVRFTQGYVSGPYCSPTRAGLMTGRYQTRFGHEFNSSASKKLGLSLKEKTIADMTAAKFLRFSSAMFAKRSRYFLGASSGACCALNGTYNNHGLDLFFSSQSTARVAYASVV
jgi:hypothetical protein